MESCPGSGEVTPVLYSFETRRTEPQNEFALDVQVLHVKGVVFDELATGLDLVAH